MATITTIDTFNGRICGQSTNGVMTNYLTDALGSVTATVDDTGAVQNTYRYKPWGGLLAKTGTASDPQYMWTGDTGSRPTGLAQAGQYNEARHYNAASGNWNVEVDNVRAFAGEPCYAYAGGNPVTLTDADGLAPVKRRPALPPASGCDNLYEDCMNCRDYIAQKLGVLSGTLAATTTVAGAAFGSVAGPGILSWIGGVSGACAATGTTTTLTTTSTSVIGGVVGVFPGAATGVYTLVGGDRAWQHMTRSCINFRTACYQSSLVYCDGVAKWECRSDPVYSPCWWAAYRKCRRGFAPGGSEPTQGWFPKFMIDTCPGYGGAGHTY